MNAHVACTLAVATALAASAANAAAKILPSGDSVPENLLRVELVLDTPLRSPLDMSRVSLADDEGTPIPDAFLDIPLASPDGKRITILMHPGRVKTGVGPNRQAGLALRRGQHLTLSIADPQLPAPVKKAWLIEPSLRTPIKIQAWQLSLPRPGSREPLQIRFTSALSANAQNLIAVSTSDGQRLAGRARLLQGERHWHFLPSSTWKPGPYELRVHASLEDPQGNRMCSAFEQVSQSTMACNAHARISFRLAWAEAPTAKQHRSWQAGPGLAQTNSHAKDVR